MNPAVAASTSFLESRYLNSQMLYVQSTSDDGPIPDTDERFAEWFRRSI